VKSIKNSLHYVHSLFNFQHNIPLKVDYVVMLSMLLYFSNTNSAYAFYKCYKEDYKEILNTNVVCLSGYSGYVKDTNDNLKIIHLLKWTNLQRLNLFRKEILALNLLGR